MRKILVSFLMAGALIPAAAHAEPGDRKMRAHEGRSESKDNSSKDRPQHIQGPERPSSDAPGVHVERAERPQRVERGADAKTSESARVRRVERQEAIQPVQQVEQTRPVERVKERPGDSIEEDRNEPAPQQRDVQVHRDRDGFSGLNDHIVKHGDKSDHHHRWSSDWRRDHRYDWRGHRSHHRSLFRLGHYHDPYGWNYRRWSIGYSLWPSYYGSNYWLNDPWQYRLPPAYGPYRWVRYYDDALLVNIYTGQVVDVVYNFFW